MSIMQAGALILRKVIHGGMARHDMRVKRSIACPETHDILPGILLATLLATGALASNETPAKARAGAQPGATPAGKQQVSAGSETIQVYFDQAKLLKLPAGTETIVIGNPAIADITIQKTGVIIITGRSPGRTNLIALDAAGAIVSESIVSVTGANDERLLVQRGLERNHYDCSPNCLPTMTFADEDKHLSTIADQMARREGFSGGLTKK